MALKYHTASLRSCDSSGTKRNSHQKTTLNKTRDVLHPMHVWLWAGRPAWLASVQSQHDSDDSNIDLNRSKWIQLARDESSPSSFSRSRSSMSLSSHSSPSSTQTGARVEAVQGERYLILNPRPGPIKKHQTYARICHSGRPDGVVPHNWMAGGCGASEVRGESVCQNTCCAEHTHIPALMGVFSIFAAALSVRLDSLRVRAQLSRRALAVLARS